MRNSIPAPVVRSRDSGAGKTAGAADRQSSPAAADVKQRSIPIPVQVVYEILMDFPHKTAFAEIEEDAAVPHIDSECGSEHKQNSPDDAQNGIFEQNEKKQFDDQQDCDQNCKCLHHCGGNPVPVVRCLVFRLFHRFYLLK